MADDMTQTETVSDTTGADTGAEQQQSAPDFSPLLDQMSQMGQKMDGLEQQFQQFASPPQEEFQQDPMADYEQLLQPDIDPQQAAQHLDQLINQRAGALLDQRLGPIQDRFRDQDFQAIEQEFPELRDAAKADAAIQAAQHLAQSLGQPEAAGHPALIRTAYLAMKAQERAGQETPADASRDVSLESGGPAGQPDEGPSIQQRIVNAGGGGPNTAWLTG